MPKEQQDDNHIGKRIDAAMKEKGVGPTKVAAYFGIKAPSVNSWKKTGRVDNRHLRKIVEYFGKPLEYWVYGTMPDAAETVAKTQQPENPSQPLINEIATGWYASKLKPPSDTRSLIDQLGDALDCCGPESRTAVAGLLHQYALSPKPGAIADAIVMFLERCKNPNADNPFPTVTPPKSTTKPTKRKTP